MVVFVTGGASGLGRATVERFARAGSKVVLGDLGTSQGNQVAKDLGENVIFVPVDVSDSRLEWMDLDSIVSNLQSFLGGV